MSFGRGLGEDRLLRMSNCVNNELTGSKLEALDGETVVKLDSELRVRPLPANGRCADKTTERGDEAKAETLPRRFHV